MSSDNDAFIQKLKRNGASEALISHFNYLYDAYSNRQNIPPLNWADIKPLSKEELLTLDNLTDTSPQHIDKVAILKLNGGLGTSMGCQGPKSLIPVINNDTFLDLIMKQVSYARQRFKHDIPFLLMNSFSTENATKAYLSDPSIIHFKQNQIPKIDSQKNAPFNNPKHPESEWAPPGHGDVYLSLYTSGVLDQLLEKGIQYLFISNSDNLGPELDCRILNHMVTNNLDFLMEVTPKTAADIKGGTIIKKQGQLSLLERAQVPEDHISEFEDTQTFPIFNTNNIWVNVAFIKEKIESNTLNLPVIFNQKEVDGRAVMQLETAMGAAIEIAQNSQILVVDRNRFLPVKTTSDLLILQSDFIIKNKNGSINIDPESTLKYYPKISLHESFKTVDGYTQRLKAIPSLKQCTRFSIQKDCILDKKIIVDGELDIR